MLVSREFHNMAIYILEFDLFVHLGGILEIVQGRTHCREIWRAGMVAGCSRWLHGNDAVKG